GQTVLHNELNLKLALPLLEKMYFYDRNVLLSILDDYNNTPYNKMNSADYLRMSDSQCKIPLHYKESFISALPDLHELPTEDIARLLSMRDSIDNTPLHNYEIFKLALPLLAKLPGEDLLKILSIQNLQGNAPLDHADSIQAAVPLFAKLPSDILIKIFCSIYRNKRGSDPVLRNNDLFKLVFPVLEKMQENDILELLWEEYPSDNFLLHNVDIVQLIIPFLFKLQSVNITKLIFSTSYNPLKNDEILKLFIPLLQTLKPEHQIKMLFSTSDPVINDLETLVIAMPLLEKLNPNIFINKLSYFVRKDIGVETFKFMIPFFEKLNNEELMEFFSIKDDDDDEPYSGRTVLFNAEKFKLALPFLLKLEPKDILKLLCLQSNSDQTALHNPDVFELAIPLLKKLEPQDLIKLLSIKGYEPTVENYSEESESEEEKLFTTTLHNQRSLEKIMPFLETLDSDVLVEILSIKDDYGRTILEFIDLFDTVLPLLKKLDLNNLFKFLYIPEVVHYAIPLLDKLESEKLVEYFSLFDENGETLLHRSSVFMDFFPQINKWDSGVLFQILTIKNARGQIPLHHPVSFKFALGMVDVHDRPYDPLNGFQKLSDDTLNQLFSMQDNEGKTILHDPLIFKYVSKAVNLYSRLNPEVFQIRNNAGFLPEEWGKIFPSIEWLHKNKATTELKVLSKADYQEKSTSLKKNLDVMWESFVFGEEEGNIPGIFLEIDIDGDNILFTSEEVKNNLNVMVGKIINQEAWLGTPPKSEGDALHNFYSQMLTNFEQVVEGLNLAKSPKEMAGILIGIAKVQLEGRCAAAYQSEIEQARMLLDSNVEEAGLVVNFNKFACASLIECIEKIVRNNYEADSHVFNQMLFSVGLAANSDPLVRVNVPHCQEMIFAEWTKDWIVSSLTENIGRLGVEQLQNWFELLTPETYGQDFLVKQEKLIETEQEIVRDTKDKLQEMGLQPSLITSCSDMFQSTQGASLRVGINYQKFLSDAVFNRLLQATTLDDIQAALEMLKLENASDRSRREALRNNNDALKAKKSPTATDKETLENIRKEMRGLQEKQIFSGGELSTMKLSAETRIKLRKLIEITNPSLSKDEFNTILAQKKIFDDAIFALADKMDISFVPRETGLPSRGVERLRRIDYASQFFTKKDGVLKLNKRGAVEIVLRIDVLESA
ncbi:MAG TPA: hypothetical protein VGP47_00895, partial [Parachlamydiaceae bacterium]|nr:hypothetical protein [Parachlamydiaceae bacterium]